MTQIIMLKSHNEQLTILKAKDLSNTLNVSLNTAFTIYKDIKKEYNVKRVTKYHLFKYLKIPTNI
jgi:hypothetical protein